AVRSPRALRRPTAPAVLRPKHHAAVARRPPALRVDEVDRVQVLARLALTRARPTRLRTRAIQGDETHDRQKKCRARRTRGPPQIFFSRPHHRINSAEMSPREGRPSEAAPRPRSSLVHERAAMRQAENRAASGSERVV